MPLIRKEPLASNGWDNGDIDVALQLFACGMVWDGNLASKDSRDHLVREGYAVRHGGMQALTGRGVLAVLHHPATVQSIDRRWALWGRNPLVATPEQIKRAMD